MKIGREMQIIDCRETAGIVLGGGLAQAGTFAEAEVADVIVLSMGPTKRHITKPVCEITYGMRERGIQVSVLVLRSGIGPPPSEEFPDGFSSMGSISSITEEEEERMRRHKLVIIHLGEITYHLVYKAKVFLRNVAIPAIVICQAEVDFKDFADAGVMTIDVRPKDPKTEGIIVDIVTGVFRGQTCPQYKLDEITEKVEYWLDHLPKIEKKLKKKKS
jgi:methyl-coenzyme M reductase subunit C